MNRSKIPLLPMASRVSLATACLLVVLSFFQPAAQGGQTDSSNNEEKTSKALSFPISYTGEGLGNIAGGYKRGAVYEGLLSVGVQGDLDKLFGWQGASFLVSGIYPHGPSLTGEYVHDFNRVSRIDAYNSVRLYEAWLQQEFANGKFSLRAGQLLADTEFFVSDSAYLFLNGAFGDLPVITQNFSAPAFPVAAPGIRARWSISDSTSVQAGLYSGAGDPATTNKHGMDWRFCGSEGALGILESTYKWNSEKESKGLPGVFKLGAFFHSSETDETFPDSQARAGGGGYFIVDQQLWKKPDTKDQGLTGFLRVGGAPFNHNIVPFYFDTGLNFKGLIPARDKDIAGIAFLYTKLKGNLSDETGQPLGSHSEAVLEATYKVAVKDWFNVQPDFQYIFNPGAGSAQYAIVVGLRFNLTFQ